MGSTKRPLQLVSEGQFQKEQNVEGEDIFDNVEDDRGPEDTVDKDTFDTVDKDTEPPADENILNTSQHNRYNLRSRQINQTTISDFKMIPIYVTNMKTTKSSSILKSLRTYKPEYNFDIEKFRLNDRPEFKAHKKALFLHGSNCFEKDSPICIFHNSIKITYFVDNDIARYNFGHHNLSDIKISNDSCRVTFADTVDCKHENSRDKIEVNWTRLQLSTYYYCSLREMSVLKN